MKSPQNTITTHQIVSFCNVNYLLDIPYNSSPHWRKYLISPIMNTPFQDTYLSADNLRLYLETPESELIRNVNPVAQQTAIIAKRQYSQSPSPESKLRKAQNNNRSGKLSLHLLPKFALSSINTNELIQLATQRNAEIQCQPRIEYSRCNSLRSLSPS